MYYLLILILFIIQKINKRQFPGIEWINKWILNSKSRIIFKDQQFEEKLYSNNKNTIVFFFRMLAKQDTVKNLISMSCAESNKIIPKKMDWENIQ